MLNNLTLKKLVGLYWVTFFSSVILCNIFEPITYSFSNFAVGIGRFSDFFNIFSYAEIFPNVGAYCVTPWHLIFFSSLKYYPQIKVITFCILVGISIYLWGKSFETITRNNKIEVSMGSVLYLYPLIFCFWRGNTELFAFSFLFIALVYECYYRSNNKSIIFYLIACFIKPNYFIFSLLFLRNIKYKNKKVLLLVTTLFTSIIFLCISLFENIFFVYNESKICMQKYRMDYIVGEGGTLFNNSYWGALKTFYYFLGNDNKSNQLDKYLTDYINVSEIIFLTIFAIAIFKLDFLEKCIVLMAASIVLYPVSADYRLITLIIPLILMIGKDFVHYRILILIIFIIMLPKHFLLFKLTSSGYDVTLSSILNPLLLTLLIITTLFIQRKKL